MGKGHLQRRPPSNTRQPHLSDPASVLWCAPDPLAAILGEREERERYIYIYTNKNTCCTHLVWAAQHQKSSCESSSYTTRHLLQRRGLDSASRKILVYPLWVLFDHHLWTPPVRIHPMAQKAKHSVLWPWQTILNVGQPSAINQDGSGDTIHITSFGVQECQVCKMTRQAKIAIFRWELLETCSSQGASKMDSKFNIHDMAASKPAWMLSSNQKSCGWS